MGWQRCDGIEGYVAAAGPVLGARPVENTVALTQIDQVRAGRRWSDLPMLFAVHVDPASAAITGAVSRTPPYGLLLAEVPEETIGELVKFLWDNGIQLPSASGPAAVVDPFVAAWCARSGATVGAQRRERLYVLDALAPGEPPHGRARRATGDDVPVLAGWMADFLVHIGSTEVPAVTLVEVRVSAGLMWLWDDGGPRSMAGRQPTAARVARVGPVYTPPEHRGRGYGTAVTAACTADALLQDAERTVLFTDLDNPTSNAIYQRLGYRAVRDQATVQLD